MAKRKKDTSAQSAMALRRNGWQAFSKNDYASAINQLERSYKQQADPQTAVILAEALFRRAVSKKAQTELSPEVALSHLQRAHQLRPKESVYAYHLALALHRLGRLAEAVPLYQEILAQQNAFRQRAAYPLTMALLQQGKNPADSPAWRELSASEQKMLRYGAAIQGLTPMPDEGTDFWQGIVALRNGRFADAQPLLQQALEAPENASQKALVHYGLGLLAAQQEDLNTARSHWQAAIIAGLNSPQLHHNLAELYHRMAEERLQANNVTGALQAAQEAARLYGERPSSLNELEAQALQRLGYQAAQSGEWETAFSNWLKARELDGSSFRLAYNFALVLEKKEKFEEAAEAWREALRRRPRRADHPDAINDEQVTRIWRRAAEAYQRAGAYDDAVQVFRNAVKGDENNLAVRLALAETLTLNGQLRAAENELERILQRDPNNIPALLQLGEVIAAQDQGYSAIRAVHLWKKVLALDPNNAQARHFLADYHVNNAEAAYAWGDVTGAIESYREALIYQPDDAPILAALGSCFLFTADGDSADLYINQAIERAPTDLRVYDPIIRAWLELEDFEAAERVMEQAKTAVPVVPYQFYLSLATFCLINEWEVPLQPWLDRAVAAAPASENILLAIGEMLMLAGREPDLAVQYLEAAIAAKQQPANAYLTLGIIAAQQGKEDLAEKHWREAEKLARKAGNDELLDHIRSTRDMFTGPLAFMLRQMHGGSMPNLLQMTQMFMDDFDGFMDDEDWDDEDWDDDELF